MIKRIFRVYYWGDFSFVNGDFHPDIFKTKDCLVFTEALKFAQSQQDTARIEEVLFYNKPPKEVIADKWEINGTEYYRI